MLEAWLYWYILDRQDLYCDTVSTIPLSLVLSYFVDNIYLQYPL